MSINREIDNKLISDGFYRLFLISKSQIPNRFFRITSGKFYKINNEIIKVGTTIVHTLKSYTGWVREAIFFTEHKYTEDDIKKYLNNKKRKIIDLDSLGIKVTVTKETKSFDALVKYIKTFRSS